MFSQALGTLFLMFFSWQVMAADPQGYVGSEQCAGCHQHQYQAWQQSHHFKAMQLVSPQTVMGNFNNTQFEYFGTTSRFYRKGDEYWVDTDNAQGEIESFKIAYVFGFEPLQQYLIAFPGGRYQALNVVWDSRPKADGGQRWYHLYAESHVPHDDPLHWTGVFQNWNSRCASCHSTNLRKNYQQNANQYQTTWSEMNVACEACHGPAKQHMDWVQLTDTPATPSQAFSHKGFAFSLADSGQWLAQAGTPTAKREGAERPVSQVDSCAHCHSRRSELHNPPQSNDFLQSHQSRFLAEGLYYPDGQILDEVYVYDSFLQSKMHRQGVVCSNCHEPHSGQLKLPGNGVCLQCHQAANFDTPKHHKHSSTSAGALCADCHMPETTYMGVDDRRDHSIRIPRPDISLKHGTPNACNQCHQDQSHEWSANWVEQWYGQSIKQRSNHADTFSRGWQGDVGGLHALIRLANDPQQHSIYRASALQALAGYPSQDSYQTAIQQLRSDDPRLRVAAIRALAFVAADRRQFLFPLLNDPVKAVRLAAAPLIAEIPQNNLPEAIRLLLNELFAEYIDAQQFNADMPGAQLNLGHFYALLGDNEAAEQAYQQALLLAPRSVPGLLNFADYYRATGRDRQAQSLLQKAIVIAPEQASVHHALGLLFVRQQQLSQALNHLQKAATLQPSTSRYTYVYGVALERVGQLAKAINVLEHGVARHPADRQLKSALMHYYQRNGQLKESVALKNQLHDSR